MKFVFACPSSTRQWIIASPSSEGCLHLQQCILCYEHFIEGLILTLRSTYGMRLLHRRVQDPNSIFGRRVLVASFYIVHFAFSDSQVSQCLIAYFNAMLFHYFQLLNFGYLEF